MIHKEISYDLLIVCFKLNIMSIENYGVCILFLLTKVMFYKYWKKKFPFI